MTRIILNGCFGRMGKAVRELADKNIGFEIVAGIEIAGERRGLTFPTYREFAICDMPADVIIDFSHPTALPSLLAYACDKKMPVVICTTGFTQEDISSINTASEKIAIFKSANMSLGINLIANMVEKAAKLLYNSHFDIEIIEKHHNKKLDAPSGTAMMLADIINNALGGGLNYIYDRTGRRQEREPSEIGITALRGGTITGEHSIVFAGINERIEFNHIAQNREVFALGAVKAADYILGKPPGLYDMQYLINMV